MADVGIRGEQAGTTLRGGLVQLLNPSQKTAKMMEKMGIKITDANGKFLGLAGVIREFQKSMKGMTDTQKLATLSQLVGTEAASGFLALMKAGPGEIEKMTKALENSAGASQKAAKKMMGGLGGALEQLRGSIETMKINIGDALTPIIIKFVKWLTKLVDWFNNLSPSARKFISVTALVLGVITGLIATVATAAAGFGLFMMSVAPLMPMFTKLGSLFALLVSPVGLVVAGIAALAGGFILLYKKSEPFRNTVDSIASTLKGKFSSALTTASGVLAKVRDIFSGIIQTKVAPFFKNVGDAISKAFNGDFSGIAELLGNLVPSIIAMLVGGIPGLVITAARFMPAIAQGIQQTLPTLLQTISQIITSAISFLAQYLPVFVQTGMTVLNNIAQGLITALPAIVLAISNILTMVITTIGNYLPTFIQTGVTVLTNLVDGLTQALPMIVSAALTVITTLITAIANALPTVISAGVTILTSLLSGITQMLPSLVDAALQIILTIVNSIVSNLPKLIDAGIKILNALIDGIVSILPKLITAGVTLIISLVVALVNNLPKILSAGAKILTTLINGIIKVLPQLIAAVPKIIVAIVGALIKNLPQILAAGGKILLALITGILKLIPQLLKLGPQLVSALAGAVIKSVPRLVKVGADLIRGLWNGIKSVKNWILSKIGGFVDSIVGGIKKFFGVHSPSRVMRDEVGRWIPAGLIDGINKMKSDVIDAAQQMAKWATPDVPEVSVAYATPNGVYGTLNSAVNGSIDVESRDDRLISAINKLERRMTDLKVIMNDREVGRIIEPTITELQKEAERRKQRFRG